MGELRFVYNGTLPEEAADKIVEYVLDALAVVDDAAVAFHDKDETLCVGQRVRILIDGHLNQKEGFIDAVYKCSYAVSFEKGEYHFFTRNELEPVESADDA